MALNYMLDFKIAIAIVVITSLYVGSR